MVAGGDRVAVVDAKNFYVFVNLAESDGVVSSSFNLYLCTCARRKSSYRVACIRWIIRIADHYGRASESAKLKG